MRKILKMHAVIVVFLLTVFAMGLTASANAGGFSVKPVFPENQNPESKNYFDLKMQPGQKQDITVTISNTNNEEIAVSVEAVTATTNGNGIINYTSPGVADETMKYGFADISKMSESGVTIPADGSKNVTLTIDMPEEPFDGIILGSIRVTKDLTDKEREEGGMIVNRYSYVIAVRLRENDSAIEPELLLGGVSAKLTNHRASIVANIRNPKPRMMKGAWAVAEIYPRGNGTAIFEASSNVDFAPNSVFPFSMMDKAGYGITAGWYTAKIEVQYNDQKWNFEEDFEIKPEQAAAINQKSVNQSQQRQAGDDSGLPLWAVIVMEAGGVILIAAVVLIIVMIRGKNRDDDGEDEDGDDKEDGGSPD